MISLVDAVRADPTRLEPVGAPLAIVAALPEEMRPLLAASSIAARREIARCRISCGKLEGRPVVLAITGDGAASAARSANALFEAIPVRGAVVVGISGGLAPALSAGRLIVAREILDGHETAPAPSAPWTDRIVEVTGARPAVVLASPSVLHTREAKHAAFARISNRGSDAAVDLESAAFAWAAAAHDVPFVVLRAIADTADETLPLDFDQYRRPDGSMRRGRIALAGLLRPWTAPGLWRLRSRVATCAEVLGRAVRSLVAGGFA